MKKSAKLFEQINLWDVAKDGTILGCSGEAAILCGLRSSMDVSMLSENEEGNWLDSVGKLLATLPAQSALSFIVDVEEKESAHTAALKRRVRESRGGPVAELLSAKAASLGSKQRSQSAYLLLNLFNRNFLKLPLLCRAAYPWPVLSNRIAERHEKFTAELSDIHGLLAGQATAAGVTLNRLGREEVLDFYWRRLNPAKAGAGIKSNAINQNLTLRSQLALSPAAENSDSFWVDGFYHKSVSLYAPGEFLEAGGIERLLSKLPLGSALCVHLLALDLETALEGAKTQARRSASLSFLQGSKNYEAVARNEELDELITLVRSKGQKLYRASVAVQVRVQDPKVCDDLARQALTLFRECLGGEALVEDLRHRRLFLSTLPLGAIHAPRRHTFTDEACSRLAVFSAPWQGTAGEQGMLFKTREGEVLSFDPFDGGTPRHGIVIGSTGSGKSFTMNSLILNLFAADPTARFAVIDIGGSYQRMCEILGGSYFELSLSERFAMNPFPSLAAMKGDGGDFDPDQLGFVSLLMEKMLMERVGQNHKRILEQAIRRLYGDDPGREPLLEDFLRSLEAADGPDNAEAVEMLRSLRYYTDGIYGKILNRPSRIKPFDGRLTVFDLARLKEHKELQAILVFLIGFGLSRQMADRQAKKIIIFDEAWEFFNDPLASELISRLYRTARKFNAAIISASQSPVDFLKSQASTAMLANSFWKVFLRLDMGHDELKAFGLNEAHIQAVRSLTMQPRKFSEMLLTYGSQARVVRVEPTALEYWIATTNAEECSAEEERAKTHRGDRFSLVKALANNEPVCA